MKVAFYSYPSAFQNPGGGEIQLLNTKKALEEKGVEVKLFDQWNDRLEDFDILHIFGSVKDCIGLMRTAKNKGVKIVLSTIFYSNFKRAIYESGRARAKVDLLFRHLIKLVLPNFPSGRRETMLLADALLPNGNAEKSQLIRLFAMPAKKIFVVPNGVDKVFKDANPDLFMKRHNIADFSLAVGRIEPRKNQLNLIRAFNKIRKNLVIIGDPVSDYPDYYKKCKDTASENIYFLKGIDHEDPLLASVYAASSLFIVPGWFETPGLAALEAGLAGTKIAVTKYGCTKDYFLDFVKYFDPSSINDIIKAVEISYRKQAMPGLWAHIHNNYTWDKVADATLNVYKKVIGDDN